MKHKFIAKRYWKNQSTAMGQSDVLAKSFDDVINLSLGDPDLITHELIIEKAFEVVPAEKLYDTTGIQFMKFNTLFQLHAFNLENYQPYKNASKMLFMPDLFAYFLTGAKRIEYTNASTTGLLDPNTKDWNEKVLAKLGLKKELFGEIIKPGEIYGNLLPEICEELHCDSVPVIAVATHDTASAVASVPTQEKDYAYISCGTWSLFGTVNDEPILTEEAMNANFTNEELEAIDRYKVDFERFVAEQEALWLKNGGPTDEEWQAYLDTLTDLCGMNELLEIYQNAYNRYVGK